MAATKTKVELTAKHEKFCQMYVSEEFYGNGVQTYMEVYDDEINRSKPNWYKTACAASSRLLSSVKICDRINELLSDAGLNDGFIDKQLLFLVTQHDDKTNKLGAIREYNKLKQRIVDKTESEQIVNLTYRPLKLPAGFDELDANSH